MQDGAVVELDMIFLFCFTGIGFSTVLNISIRKARSRLRGSTQALCISSKYNQSRFEFVFTSLVKNSPRLFTTVQAVLR